MGMGSSIEAESGQEDLRQEADQPLAPRRKFDRRTLIKGAAATGAVVWSAPVIFDSLASPAAAASCGAIYRFEFVMDAICGGGDGATTDTVGSYSPDCWGPISPPPGYSVKPTDIASGKTTVNQCVVLVGDGTNTVAAATGGGCDSRANNNVTATITQACTPDGSTSLTSCNGTKTFLAAGYVWRTDSGPSYCRTVQVGGSVVKSCTGTVSDCDTATGRDGALYQTKTITTATSSTIVFMQPASTKGPDKSGAYQFVVGCNCA